MQPTTPKKHTLILVRFGYSIGSHARNSPGIGLLQCVWPFHGFGFTMVFGAKALASEAKIVSLAFL